MKTSHAARDSFLLMMFDTSLAKDNNPHEFHSTGIKTEGFQHLAPYRSL